jgi:hypothetical protein
MRILATNAPILDGAHSVADVRGALNKKIDFALASFNKVTRHSGTAGVYNIWLEVRGVQLDTDGVEYCRKLLMRTIDCLEGG